MNFREYVTESNLSSKSLKELELLLRNAESEADIKAIKQAIKKIKGKKPVQTAGNQNLSSGDSLSVGGEGGTPPADGGTSADGGGGAAVVGGPVSEEMIDGITKQFDKVDSELESLISLMNKVDKKYTRQLKDSLMKIEVTINDYINTK